MHETIILLEEKERKLTEYLESHTTEEVIKEVQNYNPSLCFNSDIIRKLRKMKLTQSVLNTLILYVLATNKKRLMIDRLIDLGDLCSKFNIKNAHAAITFLKQYNS